MVAATWSDFTVAAAFATGVVLGVIATVRLARVLVELMRHRDEDR